MSKHATLSRQWDRYEVNGRFRGPTAIRGSTGRQVVGRSGHLPIPFRAVRSTPTTRRLPLVGHSQSLSGKTSLNADHGHRHPRSLLDLIQRRRRILKVPTLIK